LSVNYRNMELLISASLIAAFFAGVAALFAPCCVTVLLPSYLASIFRQKYKVFLMTFIFFLGIATVFLPIGLGAAALSQIFSRYHNVIFGAGGIFLIIMGLVLVLGKKFSMPFKVHPKLEANNAVSVYVLGIFSGIATTCCAPVLAGVIALTVMPGSVFLGVMYTLAYVLGMVVPLFILASLVDKTDATNRFMVLKKQVEYTFLGSKIRVAVSDIISGAIFLLMGLITTYLAFVNRLFVHSAYQTNINIYVDKITKAIGGIIGFVPQYVWALVVLLIIILITKKSINQFKK